MMMLQFLNILAIKVKYCVPLFERKKPSLMVVFSLIKIFHEIWRKFTCNFNWCTWIIPTLSPYWNDTHIPHSDLKLFWNFVIFFFAYVHKIKNDVWFGYFGNFFYENFTNHGHRVKFLTKYFHYGCTFTLRSLYARLVCLWNSEFNESEGNPFQWTLKWIQFSNFPNTMKKNFFALDDGRLKPEGLLTSR